MRGEMTRRGFVASVVVGGGGVLVPGRWLQQERLRVNGDRLNGHLSALARFGATAEGGISRVAYSDADLDAREYVLGLMRDAGLETSTDLAGNLVGRRAGTADLPPLIMGSHIDSVPQGGNYDGQVGSMGAIEVAHTIHERNIETRHPLEVLIFQNEEGGKTGSRAISGEVEAFELALDTASGKTIGEGIRLLGGDPERLADARRRTGDIAAYLELHIEQGAILDTGGITIGVVEGIVGIKRWNVTVEGFANHAGTTPMDARRDALVSASALVQAVNEIARTTPGRQVATVGRIEASPGAPNVVPGWVTLSLEIRDLQMDKIDSVFAEVRDAATAIGAESGTSFGLEQFYVSRAALTDPRIQRTIAAAAGRLDLSVLNMPSGAGHDAQSIALLAPVGMIFVPSVQGISHSPREYSRPADIEAGTNVLLHTFMEMDEASWE